MDYDDEPTLGVRRWSDISSSGARKDWVPLEGMRPGMIRPTSTVEFKHLTYEITTKEGPLRIVDDVSVKVGKGQMLAILGPSGSGKSTLLDIMSFRKKAAPMSEITMGGRVLNARLMSELASYVEQYDQQLGVLTVRESIAYSARLSGSGAGTNKVVDHIINALGLQNCENLRIGTALQRGVSGGQRRRVTVGTGLVTFPRILFLDEPTSGLDSAAAREVMASIRRIAEAEGICVIASIHAPSIETLQLFDQFLVMAKGRTAFLGSLEEATLRCAEVGHPIPPYHNPADFLLHLVSDDFGPDRTALLKVLYGHHEASPAAEVSPPLQTSNEDYDELDLPSKGIAHRFTVVWVLMERTFVNYSRNLLAYGIRIGMYAGMGLLLATIWIRLGLHDTSIDDRLSVHFFAVAFLAFMSVAGIPAFLEERAVFIRERRSGFYGPVPFVIANSIVTLPVIFICTLLFTLIVYWAIGLHPGAEYFFRFLAFLYLALLIAETQSILIASIVPIFVAALALTAFVNGFWMCVEGYFIRGRSLPRFWYYSFHFMDYQTFAYELLVKNDMRGLLFQCQTKLGASDCSCVYPPSALTQKLHGACVVSGEDITQFLGFGGISTTAYAFILVGILCLYRIFLLIALHFAR